MDAHHNKLTTSEVRSFLDRQDFLHPIHEIKYPTSNLIPVDKKPPMPFQKGSSNIKDHLKFTPPFLSNHHPMRARNRGAATKKNQFDRTYLLSKQLLRALMLSSRQVKERNILLLEDCGEKGYVPRRGPTDHKLIPFDDGRYIAMTTTEISTFDILGVESYVKRQLHRSSTILFPQLLRSSFSHLVDAPQSTLCTPWEMVKHLHRAKTLEQDLSERRNRFPTPTPSWRYQQGLMDGKETGAEHRRQFMITSATDTVGASATKLTTVPREGMVRLSSSPRCTTKPECRALQPLPGGIHIFPTPRTILKEGRDGTARWTTLAGKIRSDTVVGTSTVCARPMALDVQSHGNSFVLLHPPPPAVHRPSPRRVVCNNGEPVTCVGNTVAL